MSLAGLSYLTHSTIIVRIFHFYPHLLTTFSTEYIHRTMLTAPSPQNLLSGTELPPPENRAFPDDDFLDHAKAVPRQQGRVSTKLSTEKKFRLLKLPPELRVMIYKPLIRIGDLVILRVSKLVSQEAVPLLPKTAVLRANVGRRFLTSPNLDLTASILWPRYPALAVPDTFQYVNFRIDMASFGVDFDLRLINYFGGNEITRETCDITIFVNGSAEIPSELEHNKTYRAIATLTGFKVLLLKFEYEVDPQESAAVQEKYGRALVQMGVNRKYRRILECYEKPLAFLKTTLGPADCQKHIDRHFLRFRPSQYKIGDCPVAAAKASGGGV